METAVETLRGLGAELRAVSLPRIGLAGIAGDAISFSEVALYHRRWLRERARSTSPRRWPTSVSPASSSRPTTSRPTACARLITHELVAALEHVDAIVTPNDAVAAIRPSERSVRFADGYEESALYAYCRLTYPANVSGLPALALPCGSRAPGSRSGSN